MLVSFQHGHLQMDTPWAVMSCQSFLTSPSLAQVGPRLFTSEEPWLIIIIIIYVFLLLLLNTVPYPIPIFIHYFFTPCG